jgi:hypothetical protein
MRRLIAIALLAIVLAWCTPAMAGTWSATGDALASASLVKGSGAWLELPWSIIWRYDTNEPRSVERLPSGNTLIARGYMGVVEEVTPAGAIAWEYRGGEGFYPWHATRLPNGNTLIVSRRADEVFEVSPAGAIVWRYGGSDVSREASATLVPGYPGYVQDPFSATRLTNGNTLICDNQSGLVLEVRTSDYRAGELNDGYTPDSIRWSYAPGGSCWPKTAQRLSNGNTLIAASDFVVEVDAAGSTVWQLGTPVLRQPVSAYRLDDGTTLIAEERSPDSLVGRAVRVNSAGEALWSFSTANLLGLDDPGLSAPRRAVPGTDGSVLIADESNNRLIELGYALSGTAESQPIDCALPGARKRFTSLSVEFDLPESTSASLEYSIDGEPWLTAAGGALPSGTYGTLIRYRVTMTATRRDVTPRFLGISIGYEPAPESGGDPGAGSGSGSGSSNRSGRSSQPSSSNGTGTGTMASGGGYTSEGVSGAATVAAGALSLQRGWAMDSVSMSVGPSFGGANGGGSPAPDSGGLIALGVVYAAGIASATFPRLLMLLVHRASTA